DGIRDDLVTGVQTCALPISGARGARRTVFLQIANGVVSVPSSLEFDWPRKHDSHLYATYPSFHTARVNIGTARTGCARPGCGREIGRASCRERVESRGVRWM